MEGIWPQVGWRLRGNLKRSALRSKPIHPEQFPPLQTGISKNSVGPMLVYVVGVGHCGSTLLSLALDRHPDVFAVSEIIGLNAKIPGWSKNEEDCRQHAF